MKFGTKNLKQQRVIAISGISNLRDLGGYPASGGGATRWKVVLRSAGTERLLKDGQRKLIDYGLRASIDLRTPVQCQDNPDVFQHSAEVAYHMLPLIDTRELETRVDSAPTADGYWLLLTERGAAFRAVMETILAAESGATLVHCSAGKDRTGLVCALLLGTAGVADDVIVEDYALSQKLLTDPSDEFRQMALAHGYEEHEYDRLMTADPAAMQDVLGRFRRHYGGIAGYLSAIGFGAEAQARLRARLVDGGAR